MKMKSFLTLIVAAIIHFILSVSGGWCAETDPPACYCDCITGDEEDAKIRYPAAVYFEPVKKEIYVIDSMARILIYTSDLFPIQTLDKRNGIDAPQGLTVDADGNLYVVQGISKEYPRCRISVYNACFKWVRDIYVQGFDGCDKFTPYRIAVDKQGKIYIAGLQYPGVIVTDNGGKYLETISPEENGRKAAAEPCEHRQRREDLSRKRRGKQDLCVRREQEVSLQIRRKRRWIREIKPSDIGER